MSNNNHERDTFSIIHDDEFASSYTGEFNDTKFDNDYQEWRDTWEGTPMKIYQNQIRTNPINEH